MYTYDQDLEDPATMGIPQAIGMTSRDAMSWENLPEEELFALHYTNAKDMDGSSRLRQHDNVHKQITAFEKLLQHSINRFSTDKLYHMLHLVLGHLSYIPPPPHHGHTHADESYDEISSLAQLREILIEFRDPQKKGIEKEEQAHVCKYFDTFFDDIAYLKSLKKYFDERVYLCLYDYFYDPEDDTLDPKDALGREREGRVKFDEEKDSGNSSLRSSDEEKASRKTANDSQDENELEFYFDRLLDDEKMFLAVRKMFQLNERWDALFDDGEIDSSLFDPDSKHEIISFSDYDQFVLVLRLVPDIFVKAYKSIEVAKLWWTQANKIYEVFPQKWSKKKSEKEINAKIVKMERKVTGLRDEIRTKEDLLMMQNDDLRHIQDREVRYINLSEQCENLEDKKNIVGDQYNELLQLRDTLKRRLEKQDPHADKYEDTIQQLRACEARFFDAQVELRMLAFQFQLAQSDFLVELDLRPELIRFKLDANMKIEETKNALSGKNQEVRDHEKRLALLKTNCERMKKIMKKYLDSQNEKKPGKEDGKKLKKRAGEERKHGMSDLDHQRVGDNLNDNSDWDYYNKEGSLEPKETKTDRKPNKEHKRSREKPADNGQRRKAKSRERNEGGDGSKKKDTNCKDNGHDADTETPTPPRRSREKIDRAKHRFEP